MSRSGNSGGLFKSSMYIRRVVLESPIGKALIQPTYEEVAEQITSSYTHLSKRKIRNNPIKK